MNVDSKGERVIAVCCKGAFVFIECPVAYNYSMSDSTLFYISFKALSQLLECTKPEFLLYFENLNLGGGGPLVWRSETLKLGFWALRSLDLFEISSWHLMN